MHRRDFISHLTRIAELTSEVPVLRQVPLFCCRQTKINHRIRDTTNKPISLRKVNPSVIISEDQPETSQITFPAPKKDDFYRKTKRFLTSSFHTISQDEENKMLKNFSSIPNNVPKLKAQQGSPVKPVRIISLSPESKRHSHTQPCEEQFKSEKNIIFNKKETPFKSRPGSSLKKINRKIKINGEEIRKRGVSLRKEPIAIQKLFEPPSKITAKSYLIYEVTGDERIVHFSFNSKNRQEVASLTKIMTCIVVLELTDSLGIDRSKEEVLIGKMESSLGGTSADLEQGQIYTLEQLLYGLMLPSGNDASVALAVWAGKQLLERDPIQVQKKGRSSQSTMRQSVSSCLRSTSKSSNQPPKKSTCYNRFLREMNAKAKELKMEKTHYANSHGLINQNNKSTAYDVAILSAYAMKNPVFRKVVSTKQYKTTIKIQAEESTSDDSDGQNPQKQRNSSPQNYHSPSVKGSKNHKIQICWENTHKLLQNKSEMYVGIKTGFTTMAGPCLSSCLQVNNRTFIIVVLSCNKMSLRFKQTDILRRWVFKKEGIRLAKCKIGEESDVEVEVNPSFCDQQIED